ncbi:hypothetical protein Chor_003131 [Crotalus horridus]
MDAIQAANTAFSVDLFKKLCEMDKSANFIFSPLSLSTSLALAYKAANGDTATQMKQGLHLEDVKDIPFGFQTITSDAAKLSSFYSLKMIKRLYVEKSLNPSVLDLTTSQRKDSLKNCGENPGGCESLKADFLPFLLPAVPKENSPEEYELEMDL